MLIKKQTDDSPSEKDHTEGRAVYLSTLKDAAAALGTYSYEILVALLKHMHYKWARQSKCIKLIFDVCYFFGGGADLLKSVK